MTESAGQDRSVWKRFLGIFVPFFILGLGIAGAKYFIDTRPTPSKKVPMSLAPLVRVQRAIFGREQVIVHAMGTVIPARKTILSPEVSGRVIEISPCLLPGGILSKGRLILRIDPRDYALRVREKKTALIQAKAALALEQGRQEVARHEWSLLRGEEGKETVNPSLALRKPQLEQARASVEEARLSLDQAELNLARTSLLVPFNALVLDKNIDLGSYVSPQTSVATLVGTDVYWVRTSVPCDRLSWISVPKGGKGQGSQTVITSTSEGITRMGTVIRRLGDVEPDGRMARILVRLEDPLYLRGNDASRKPLLLGEYVRVAISGRMLDHVVAIARDALRDGNHVWIATADDRLDIRPVKVAWRDEHIVYLDKGVLPGERIVLSDIAAPVQGMSLRVRSKSQDVARILKQQGE